MLRLSPRGARDGLYVHARFHRRPYVLGSSGPCVSIYSRYRAPLGIIVGTVVPYRERRVNHFFPRSSFDSARVVVLCVFGFHVNFCAEPFLAIVFEYGRLLGWPRVCWFSGMLIFRITWKFIIFQCLPWLKRRIIQTCSNYHYEEKYVLLDNNFLENSQLMIVYLFISLSFVLTTV